jgi:hypothetical protein
MAKDICKIARKASGKYVYSIQNFHVIKVHNFQRIVLCLIPGFVNSENYYGKAL